MTANKTIAEIARLAGVGTATVDRVLNGRPGVAPETATRVREAMATLAVDSPARGRPRKAVGYRVAFVLPATRLPLYDMVDRQIAQMAGDFRHLHITEVTHRFDPGDPDRFAADLASLEEYDGVVLFAPDVPAIKLAVNELVRAGVQVITLMSDLAGSLRASHVGMDNRAAGRTAALLIGRIIGTARPVTVLLTSQTTRYAAEIDRRVGFAQLLEERFPNIEILRLLDLPSGEEDACATVARLLTRPDLRDRLAGLYAIGSCAYGVTRAVRAAGFGADFASVAHDLSEGNRRLLVNGSLSFVLHQDVHDCVMTATKALLALRESLRGPPIAVPPRLEILTSENLT
jgi:LacI family transcriptional regulator